MNPEVAPRASENSRPLYPNPVIDQAGGDIGGYFLDGDHGDVAVLSASSFEGSGAQGSVAFQETIEKFLSECKKAGKKKLIVDVTGNGGGTILLGYDMFKQVRSNSLVLAIRSMSINSRALSSSFQMVK